MLVAFAFCLMHARAFILPIRARIAKVPAALQTLEREFVADPGEKQTSTTTSMATAGVDSGNSAPLDPANSFIQVQTT